jgi:uncharacterized cupredoxin-like copper-binding protein
MMGPGMMQGMMTGMMSIRLDRQAIKAGKVELEITNWSRSLVHEVLIVPVDSPDAPLPYDYGTGQVVEDQVDVVADSSELKPSESKTLEVDLSPGSYLLLCNAGALRVWDGHSLDRHVLRTARSHGSSGVAEL